MSITAEALEKLQNGKPEVSTDEDGLVLKHVYSGVSLITSDGEHMGICMRDSGFEFNYQGKWYSAKNGVVESQEDESARYANLQTSDRGNVLVDQSEKNDSVKEGSGE